MVITLQPETGQLLAQELANGHFQSVDEMILQGIRSRAHRLDTLIRQPLPKEQRAAAFASFVESLPRTGTVVVDDSREGIYGDHP